MRHGVLVHSSLVYSKAHMYVEYFYQDSALLLNYDLLLPDPFK